MFKPETIAELYKPQLHEVYAQYHDTCFPKILKEPTGTEKNAVLKK